MRRLFSALLFVGVFALNAHASVEVGKPAPDFSLPDVDGKTHTLSDYQDKIVVLEWTNHECPFVRKHYDTHSMQGLQKTYTDKGVVWFAIVSSAEGKQGYVTGEMGKQVSAQEKSAETAKLLDPEGKVGKLYGAKTTPHMYVIDKGTLAYMGAIDDKPNTNKADIADATNYVQTALDALMAGQPIESAMTRPYGCSVKY